MKNKALISLNSTIKRPKDFIKSLVETLNKNGLEVMSVGSKTTKKIVKAGKIAKTSNISLSDGHKLFIEVFADGKLSLVHLEDGTEKIIIVNREETNPNGKKAGELIYKMSLVKQKRDMLKHSAKESDVAKINEGDTSELKKLQDELEAKKETVEALRTQKTSLENRVNELTLEAKDKNIQINE